MLCNMDGFKFRVRKPLEVEKSYAFAREKLSIITEHGKNIKRNVNKLRHFHVSSMLCILHTCMYKIEEGSKGCKTIV